MNRPRADDTVDLLRAWRHGDGDALVTLVVRELPWLERHVRCRLGELLRSRHDTQDIVQEALLGALRDGPHFVVETRGQLRALLGRIAENVLRREHERWTAGRRDARRDAALPGSDVLPHSPGARTPFTRPSDAAEASEMRAWIRLALELLSVEDRDVIVLREYGGAEFSAIGHRLGIREDAARMRFRRAMARLAAVLDRLRAGRLGDLLVEALDAR